MLLAEIETMATKKSAEPPKPKQEILLVYKADPKYAAAYREWMESLAEHVGAPVTVTLDMALKAFAEKHKHKAPPKRIGR